MFSGDELARQVAGLGRLARDRAAHRRGEPGRGGFTLPRLREWRFFLVSRPFNQHILFYELASDDIVMRRAMRGQRDLPRRLIEAPGAD
jgi:hypothetical protein